MSIRLHSPGSAVPLLLRAASAVLLAHACGGGNEALRPPVGQESRPGTSTSADDDLAKLAPARPLPTTDLQKQADAAIDSHFARHATRRAYLMVDKPIYQPGETIWFRVDLRQAASLTGHPGAIGVTMQLVSPKGAVVSQKRVLVQEGVGAGDFELPDEAQGGEYVLKLVGDDGTTDKRPVIIASYEAPRLKKTLEFVRKAHGPGDQVLAAVQVSRATGEPFAKRPLVAVAIVDDAEVARTQVTTDDTGNGIVKFTLPTSMARGDGLLTVMADDGGVTESIQKRIPIVLKTLDLSLFPEGGDLVKGIPGRVYFEAKNTIGKPADVEGRVVDDQGAEVATFKSLHDGMGRFELPPVPGRKLHVEITKPEGIARKFDLPPAREKGCVIRAIDDFESKLDEIRLATWCTDSHQVLAEAVLRERRLAGLSVEVTARKPVLISLPVSRHEQGAVRVTVFNEKREPLAERLLYRGRKSDLKVDITADRKTASPRDPVTLTVKTTDLAGKPVQASLGLSVVDDTVLSFADDKTASILAHLFLEPELGDVPIEEPNFYFSDKPEAPASMDLLMGTRGWRRFDWQLVFMPPPPPPRDYGHFDLPGAAAGAVFEGEAAVPMAAPRPVPAAPPAAARAKAAPRPERAALGPAAQPRPMQPMKPMRKDEAAAEQKMNIANHRVRAAGAGARRVQVAADEDAFGDIGGPGEWTWAPVRVFPVPTYTRGYDGPRTDFRETIFWAPQVKTGQDGTAKVSFFLSDAVTSFRVTAEGASAGGLPGRGEALLKSKMPLSLDVRMPLEVSQGDKVQIPVTLTNETDRVLTANVTGSFGSSFRLTENPAEQPMILKAGEKRAFFFPLLVGREGDGEIAISVSAEGLKDEIRKKVRVVPLGFPFELGFSGSVKGTARHEVDLAGALPGTIRATVQMFPSPLSSMIAGTEAMLREPSGCFEQTSSTNYPNIMIMRYLEENDVADPALVQRASGLMQRGYLLLSGYETNTKGYEWFGQNPGHEALTAYGLMEFEDMAQVYDEVDRSMIDRTAAWLMSRRDGKGGFERNSRALDSFGRASYETTNAYIVWTLTEARRAKGLDKELEVQKQSGLESKDPYLLALATLSWLNAFPQASESSAMAKRLAGMQGKDGRFGGAKESITMSSGQSLDIETTSLAVQALIKASPSGEYEPKIRAGVEWLQENRGGFGEWGNTQGTILSLRAMTAYAKHSRKTQASGVAKVVVNGREVGAVAFEKGRRDALVFDDLAAALTPGRNIIEIKLDSEASLPYTVAIEYRSQKPQSSPEALIGLETTLAKKTVKMGEGVRMRARITNRSDQGVPMTLARIGLPGGLTFQTWQLKELRDKGVIGFYETKQREVILYFRALAPKAQLDIDLDLVTTVPGTFVAPASQAYLYYTDEHRTWAPPVEVAVTR
ncbi:MAG: hypothetical protein HY698_13995 [Deltaproteobacteria bacterium]|nr:hypothetical protein [Deltaproteobacteria bacterium]